MSPKPYPELDRTDRAIVDALRDDGRRAYRDIARDLGVSESMVRKRAKRLLASGWMRIQAISDPLALGVPVVATTYAQVRPSALDRVGEALADYDAVRYLGIGVGAHNLVFESLHATTADLHAFLQEALALDGIVSSETMQVVKIHKSVWDWAIPAQPDADPDGDVGREPATVVRIPTRSRP